MMVRAKGQSTLEYVILVTVIISAIILVVANTGGLRTRITGLFEKSVDKIQDSSDMMKPSETTE